MIKKILITILMLFNLTNADEKINNYYEKIMDNLSAWEPVGIKQKAVIQITINEKGNFNYKFIKEADSKEFNDSLKFFLDKQKNIRYPIYKNQTKKLNVDFKTKD